MFAQVDALRRKEQHSAVESAAAAFNDADHHVDAMLSRQCGKAVHNRTGDIDGAVEISLELLAAFQ